MIKKQLSLLLCTVFAAGLATGCGSGKTPASSAAVPGWETSRETAESGAASQATAGPQKTVTLNVSRDTVRTLGRTMTVGEGEAARLYFNWSCSGFEFTFTGTGASAVFGTRNTFIAQETMRPHIAVYVDGEAEPRTRFSLESASASYTLAENLPEGEHTLRVMKISAASYSGFFYAEALTLTGAEPSAAPAAAPSRRIEFIGDSITCGYGILAPQAGGNYKAAEEDGSLSYAYRTALALNADAQMVCISGNGVYCDLKGRQSELMPEYYLYADMRLQKDSGVRGLTEWDFAGNPVDAVVVLLGTNDAQAVLNINADIGGGKPAIPERIEAFKAAYAAFIKTLREKNPTAPIFCTTGGLTSRLYAEIRAAVRAYTAETGDENVYFYEYRTSASDFSDGIRAGHPSRQVHAAMAEELTAFIREKTGW